MTPRQTLTQTLRRAEHRRSEIAERIAELSAADLDDELDDEQRAEYGGLQSERVRVERAAREAQAALDGLPEDIETGPAGGAGDPQLVVLAQRAAGEGGLYPLLRAASRPGGEPVGAAGELVAHLRAEASEAVAGEYAMPAHDDKGALVVPHAYLDSLLDLFEDQHERADTITTTAELGATGRPRHVRPIMGRVFALRDLGRTGLLSLRSVPYGRDIARWINAGATVGDPVEAMAQEADALTLRSVELTPKRTVTRLRLTDLDMATFGPDLERAARSDMRQAVMHDVERAAWAAINTAAGAIADPGAVAKFADVVNIAASSVDGTYAAGERDVVVFLGTESYAHAATLRTAGAAADDNLGDVSAIAELRDRVGELVTSAFVPDPASNVQLVVKYKRRQGSPIEAPMWSAFTLLVDPYTDSASGVTNYTATQIWALHVEGTVRDALDFAELKLA